MTVKNLMRAASVFAVMLAGSCAAPENRTSDIYDPEINHPISVAPTAQSLKVYFSPAAAGLMPDDEAHFTSFVEDYMSHGNGSISVSVPDGPGSSAAIHYFGDRIAEMGVVPSHILVGTHDANGDGRVELGYITYVAHSDECGEWSDVSDTASNLPTKNFGCATQHNIAAMVADPRDLEQSRSLGPADASRRTDVTNKYEQGKITSADKRKGDLQNEQSGTDLDSGK